MEAIPAVLSPLDEAEFAKQLKEFQESKGGVKGIVDSRVTKVPRIFIYPPEKRPNSISETKNINGSCFQVPLIDFEGLGKGKRIEIVNQIRDAALTWGFFQIVNHEFPVETMDKLLDGIRLFHEQPEELKQEYWFLDDPTRQVKFYCNSNLRSVKKATSWKDSIMFSEAQLLGKEELPLVCREAVVEYTKCIMLFKETICELLSEALGLSSEWLAKKEVTASFTLVGNYYPASPEPDLTWGAHGHSDLDLLTLILQDSVGGLQILHQNIWVNVPPIHGAFVLNFGDLMQLITNDKLKSIGHRVRVVKDRPRVSVGASFYPTSAKRMETFGPMKEFLSENNPPIYRETNVKEYLDQYGISNAQYEPSCLPVFKLSS